MVGIHSTNEPKLGRSDAQHWSYRRSAFVLLAAGGLFWLIVAAILAR